jgi:hypothetical protein
MRSNIVVLLILFCIIQVLPQQEDFQKFIENKLNSRTLITHEKVKSQMLLTESIDQEWIDNAWQNISRDTYYYDSNNFGYLTTTEIWDNNQWVNETQYWPVIDEYGNFIEEIYKAWVDTGWVNSERYLYEYDENDNIISEISQSWISTDWIHSNRYVYTYINNNLTEKLYQQWDNTDWLNVDRYQYTYVDNNLTEELFQQYISGWNNVSLIQNSFDSQNNIIETLNKRWDSGSWFLEMQFTNQYSNGNLTVVTLQEGWIGTIWTNIGLYTQEFNSNNFLVEYRSQYWHSTNGWTNQQRWLETYTADNKPLEWITQFWQNNNWENFSRLISTYDVNGNETVFAWEIWENSHWTNHIQILLTYTPITSVEENYLALSDFSLFQNYPNPFNPSTKIEYTVGDAYYASPVPVTLKVYDVLGNEIATLVDEYKPAGGYEINFDASKLSSGIYFYQLKVVDPETSSGQDFIKTKKMIYLK